MIAISRNVNKLFVPIITMDNEVSFTEELLAKYIE